MQYVSVTSTKILNCWREIEMDKLKNCPFCVERGSRMIEYIEKQDAVETAMPYCPDDDGTCSRAKEDIRSLLDELENLPQADVRPVVRSHWKKNDNGTYSCERCHSWIPEEQWHYANWGLYCGADMRGSDAE